MNCLDINISRVLLLFKKKFSEKFDPEKKKRVTFFLFKKMNRDIFGFYKKKELNVVFS